MSDDTIEDLMTQLPDRLRARRDDLQALLEGRLDADARARLEAEAETDEDLADALLLFTPFDAEELAGVEAKVQAALPASGPGLRVIDGDGPSSPPPDAAPSRIRGAWIVGGMLAAAAAVVITLMPSAPSAPFRVTNPSAVAVAPEGKVRLELEPLRGATETSKVTVLAVAGETVHRTTLTAQAAGDRLVLESAASELVGKLAGVVRVIVLQETATDPLGRVGADEVRNMMDKLTKDGAWTRVIVQPPAYALAVAAEGTVRAAEAPKTATASTALDVPGEVTFNFRPATPADGDLVLEAFVARDGGEPEALEVKARASRAAFRVTASTADVLGGAETATLYFWLGPRDQPRPSPDAAAEAPWRRIVHRVYRR